MGIRIGTVDQTVADTIINKKYNARVYVRNSVFSNSIYINQKFFGKDQNKIINLNY